MGNDVHQFRHFCRIVKLLNRLSELMFSLIVLLRENE